MASLLALLVYASFALLATVGVYLAVAHVRGRRPAVVLALVTAAFFVALHLLLAWLAALAPP